MGVKRKSPKGPELIEDYCESGRFWSGLQVVRWRRKKNRKRNQELGVRFRPARTVHGSVVGPAPARDPPGFPRSRPHSFRIPHFEAIHTRLGHPKHIAKLSPRRRESLKFLPVGDYTIFLLHCSFLDCYSRNRACTGDLSWFLACPRRAVIGTLPAELPEPRCHTYEYPHLARTCRLLGAVRRYRGLRGSRFEVGTSGRWIFTKYLPR